MRHNTLVRCISVIYRHRSVMLCTSEGHRRHIVSVAVIYCMYLNEGGMTDICLLKYNVKPHLSSFRHCIEYQWLVHFRAWYATTSVSEWVEFNYAPHNDAVVSISDAVLTANHSTDTDCTREAITSSVCVLTVQLMSSFSAVPVSVSVDIECAFSSL